MMVFEGRIEEIAGRVMRGWVRAGEVSVSIEFLENGRVLGSTIAETTGDAGRLTFEFLLPRVLFDGQVHTFHARTGGNEIVLQNNANRLGEFSIATLPAVPPTGFLEAVSEDGQVVGGHGTRTSRMSGWRWNFWWTITSPEPPWRACTAPMWQKPESVKVVTDFRGHCLTACWHCRVR